jgi:YVTN family beta-propeller protein
VVNPVTDKIYVANTGDGVVSVIDGVTLGATSANAGDTRWAIDVNPVTNRIYVANNFEFRRAGDRWRH